MRYFKYLWSWFFPQLAFKLVPKQHLLATEGEFIWQANGNDPFFYLRPYFSLPKGWYMLHIELAADVGRMPVKLYCDYGQGFSEEHSISVSVATNALTKRVCYFAKQPKRIRFDPAEQACRFTVKRFSLVKLTQGKAKQLMHKKLAANAGSLVLDGSLLNLYANYSKVLSGKHHSATYEQWQTANELALSAKEITQGIAAFKNTPVVSIILPTYNTKVAFLQDCIESVLAQSYPHWQLCIADDASTDNEVLALLAKYHEQDQRILVTYRQENGHICKASNSALSLATGEWVILLDHDDTLAEHALYYLISAINETPNAQLLYSDEDKINEQGERFAPHFKSSWNRDLFYSHNYITHLSCIKHALLSKIGGFKAGVEGAQDYDVLLRCISQIGDKQIVHIPRVLYHWRAAVGSTALSAKQKTYTTNAGLKALTDYFTKTNIPVEVNKLPLANCYNVQWPLPNALPKVSLIIPTRDGYELLKTCVTSITTLTTYQHYEIIIVNNQSRCEQTLDYLALVNQQPNISVIDYDKPFNFSSINNFAVKQAKGDIVGLINDDIEVFEGRWLTEMVRQACRPDIGCVGAKLYYPDERIQHAGVILGIGEVAGHAHKLYPKHHNGYHTRLQLTQNFSAVTAAALLVRKDIYCEVGGFEEALTVAFNDVDFCLKVREAGYRNVWTPFAQLIHHESVSRGYEDTPEKQQRFAQEISYMKEKWQGALSNDPFYSPNLTNKHEDFSLRVNKS